MRRRRYSRLKFCSSPFDMGRSHHAVETAHGAASAGEHGPPPPRWLRSLRAGRWQAPWPTNVRFSSDTQLSAALRRTAGLGQQRKSPENKEAAN
jgi:hypothetical protein